MVVIIINTLPWLLLALTVLMIRMGICPDITFYEYNDFAIDNV